MHDFVFVMQNLIEMYGENRQLKLYTNSHGTHKPHKYQAPAKIDNVEIAPDTENNNNESRLELILVQFILWGLYEKFVRRKLRVYEI